MISPLASIDSNAKIGNNVTISPFATIYADVEIGDGTWIGPNAVIMDGARIGKNCQIFPGAVVSAIPQDLKYKGEPALTIIGDNTIIRECVTINKGTVDRMKTQIGNNCLIMAYVHIAHDCIIGNNVIIVNSVNLAGHITIDDYAILEGLVAVQQFIHIGAHSFITGNTMVRKNVPPYVKAAREPIQYVGVNSVGLSRRGFKKEDITLIEDIYRLIFVRGMNITNALEQVKNEIADHSLKSEIVEFILASKDGVIRGI
jgi:UDP-N-acetylglucosamine acyltransferase